MIFYSRRLKYRTVLKMEGCNSFTVRYEMKFFLYTHGSCLEPGFMVTHSIYLYMFKNLEIEIKLHFSAEISIVDDFIFNQDKMNNLV